MKKVCPARQAFFHKFAQNYCSFPQDMLYYAQNLQKLVQNLFHEKEYPYGKHRF